MRFGWFSKTTPARKRSRGFTLVELMAASTGALFITVGVYAFTRNVTEYFQRQMRLSDTTMNAVTGFERLRTDIQRAAFLSSPNLARDPLRCPRPQTGGAATAPAQIAGQLASYPGLQRMALARLVQGATIADYGGNFVLANNAGGLSPDQLILYGNYTSTEQFPVKVALNANNQIVLEADSIPMRRLGITGVAADAAAMAEVFKPGGILRVVDAGGRHQYAILADPSVDFTTDPGFATLKLNPAVQLIDKEGASGGTCGIRGGGTDLVVSPVNIIRYRLLDLSTDPDFAPFFAADLARPAYDATRLDLVREELSPANEAVLPGTTELVTEYAVDLKFGLTVNTDVVLGANTYYGEDDPNLLNFADVPFGTPSGGVGTFGPHLIRGIHARLAVRTREADHNAPLLTGAALAGATSSGDLYRVAVAPGQYTRLRSLRAHIATRNTRSESW